VRLRQDGDFAVLQDEIRKLRQRDTELGQAHAEKSAELRQVLAKDDRWFSESEVFECRRHLAHINEQRELVSGRIAAFEARLPSPEERRSAEASARELVETIAQTRVKFDTEWKRYGEVLEHAEHMAIAVTAARARAQASNGQLAELVAKFGLPIDTPNEPAPPTSEAKIAMLIGILVSEAAFGEPSDTVMGDLSAARAECKRQAVEPVAN
jgi:hypothetical protein